MQASEGKTCSHQSLSELTSTEHHRERRNPVAPRLSFPIDRIYCDGMVADQDLVFPGGGSRTLLDDSIGCDGRHERRKVSRLLRHDGRIDASVRKYWMLRRVVGLMSGV